MLHVCAEKTALQKFSGGVQEEPVHFQAALAPPTLWAPLLWEIWLRHL